MGVAARGEGDADAAPTEEEDSNGGTGHADVNRAALEEGEADAARIAADGLVCLGAGGRATIQLDAGTGGCAHAVGGLRVESVNFLNIIS